MFQISSNNAANCNIFCLSRNASNQAANATNNHFNLNPCLRSLNQLINQIFVCQGIDFQPDISRLSSLCLFNFHINAVCNVILQAVRRYQQIFRVLDGLPHAKCIEDSTCFHTDFRTGSHQRIVRIDFRSFLVVVARANLCDIRDRIANFPCNQAQLRVYLEIIQTIDNPASSFFQSS